MSGGIVIVGAGGHGRGILEILHAAAEARGFPCPVRGFLDDAPGAPAVAGFSILGSVERAAELRAENRFVIGIGDPRVRAAVARKLDEFSASYAIAVHPSAILYREVSIGDGAVIGAGVVVAASTRLGPHSIVNLNATVGHDCVLSAFATVAPGANLGGNVHMKEGWRWSGARSCGVRADALRRYAARGCARR